MSAEEDQRMDERVQSARQVLMRLANARQVMGNFIVVCSDDQNRCEVYIRVMRCWSVCLWLYKKHFTRRWSSHLYSPSVVCSLTVHFRDRQSSYPLRSPRIREP